MIRMVKNISSAVFLLLILHTYVAKDLIHMTHHDHETKECDLEGDIHFHSGIEMSCDYSEFLSSSDKILDLSYEVEFEGFFDKTVALYNPYTYTPLLYNIPFLRGPPSY